jgi:hypothetical protein
MMSIFREYIQELPPFDEYWTLTFEKEQIQLLLVVARMELKWFTWQGSGKNSFLHWRQLTSKQGTSLFYWQSLLQK